MIDPEQVIYLDNNATTQLDPAVVEEMLPFLAKYYANPSSGYAFAAQVRDAVELARERVAALIGCGPDEVIFTSGGTESNNTALNSALQLDLQRQHIVTTAVEHSAVRNHVEHLVGGGATVTAVGVSEDGNLDLAQLEAAITPQTAIVSVMWANNETGVIFPIAQIAEIARRKGVLFHTDAIQAAGKIPLDVRAQPISFLSLSGHKIHAPKGVGALFVRRGTAFRPSSFGGSHENNRRAGTENVPGIIGMGKAAERAAAALPVARARVQAMRDRFESCILLSMAGAHVNGAGTNRLPNTSSISFSQIEADAALLMLDQYGLCCSAGSACRVGSVEISNVLEAMGLDKDKILGTLRFSFSAFNTDADVDRALEIVPGVIAKLRDPPARDLENNSHTGA